MIENKEQKIRVDLVKQCKEFLKNAKSVDDVCAVYFTLLEQKCSEEEIIEVLNNPIPKNIMDEIEKEEFLRK